MDLRRFDDLVITSTMKLQAIEAVMLVLRFLGLVSLSALLLTVVLSENIHRHTVFFNFVWTYLLYTSVMIFTYVFQVLLPIDY
jgi:hypothetical protein